MSLRQHNSKHLGRTFGAVVLPVWAASAVKPMAQWMSDITGYLRDRLDAFTGSGTFPATANLPLIAVETRANSCVGHGEKQVGRATALRRGYRRISSQPMA